jgi:hypothetical protein
MEQRLRTIRGLTPVPLNVEQKNMTCAGLNWAVVGTLYDQPKDGTNVTMLDTVVPDFFKRRKAGEKFFNPMSIEKVTVASTGSDYHIITIGNTCASPVLKGEQRTVGGLKFRSIPNYVAGGIRYPIEYQALTPDEIFRLNVEVSTACLSKRGRSDSDLWESMAEYRQTLQLLKNPLEKIRNISSILLKSASSKDPTIRNLLKEVSGGYLLYRYGITPLMKDVENILKSLQKVSGKQLKTTRSNGQISARKTVTGSSSVDTNNIIFSNEVVDVVTMRAMCLDEVDLSFGSNLGFSTKGLVTLPWELTGYSFVADWFFNIGDYLGSMAPAPGWKLLGSCIVINRVTSNAYTYSSTGMSSPAWQLAAPLNGTIGVVRELKTRGSLAPAGVVLRDDFRFDDFKRSADAFSLLAQRFIKIKDLVGPQPNLSAFRQKSAYKNWLNQPGVT